MRAVTTHAFAMALVEESRRGHLGLGLRVAAHTRRAGVRSRRMLMRMTRDARLTRVLPLRGVSRRDLLVALRARSDEPRHVLVRLVTLHTLTRSVNHDGGRVSLSGRVAALAVRRRRDVR